MKRSLSIIAATVLIVSCQKDLNPKEKKWMTAGDFTYTMQTDSLKENTDGTGTRTYHFDKNPDVAKLWMFDFVWADGYGYTFPSVEDIGHGIRLTPLDPRIPDGPQVKMSFTWYMEKDGTMIANIGGNRAEIIINGDFVVIHQIPGPGLNEIERWYYLHKVPNGTNMNGQGFIRAYGYFKMPNKALRIAV